MKVAVITPCHKTPRPWLQECLASVAKQSAACTHFLVCDGDEPDLTDIGANVKVLRLPEPHQDFGNTPRAIGSVSAISQGYEAITYLDSDNWLEPDHVRLMCEMHRHTGAPVCTTGRTLYHLNGQLLGSCPEVDGDRFVDTNCMFLTRQAFGLVATWYMMPRSKIEVGDRFVWRAIKASGLKRAHLRRATVNYRTRHQAHYRFFGIEAPPGTKQIVVPSVPQTRPQPGHEKDQLLTCAVLKPDVQRQTVSLCMIARNEETNLEKSLRSIANIVDEMIVVDTGSTDGSKEVAARCGAKVFDFPWIDDFSAARNESLRHATGTWILWLDADECFDDKNRQTLRTLFGMLGDENRVYMMQQWSASEQENGSALVVDHARLFRKQPGACWQHRVHEQILPSLRQCGAQLVWTDVVLGHIGYREVSLVKNKVARNHRLLLKDYEEHPDEPFTLFNLAGTSRDLGEIERAISYLHRCIEVAKPGATFLPKTYVMLTQIQRGRGRLDEGLRYCREGKARFPKDVELLFEEGSICLAKKDPAGAKQAFERILRLPPGPSFVGVDPGLRGHLTRHHLAIAYRQLGRLADAEAQWQAALKVRSNFGPSWLGLAELYLDQRRVLDVEGLIDRLHYDIQAKPITAALRARVCLSRDDLVAARQILEEGIAAAPRNVWLRLFFTDMLIRGGKDLDGAETHLHAILELDPRQNVAHERLRRIQQKRKGQAAEPHSA